MLVVMCCTQLNEQPPFDGIGGIHMDSSYQPIWADTKHCSISRIYTAFSHATFPDMVAFQPTILTYQSPLEKQCSYDPSINKQYTQSWHQTFQYKIYYSVTNLPLQTIISQHMGWFTEALESSTVFVVVFTVIQMGLLSFPFHSLSNYKWPKRSQTGQARWEWAKACPSPSTLVIYMHGNMAHYIIIIFKALSQQICGQLNMVQY